MKKNLLYGLILTCIIITFTSCSKDDNNNPVTTPETTTGMFILNEGVYGHNNSSLSYLDFKTSTVTQDVYASENSTASLGDDANNMVILNGKGYIAVDNSNKIEIIDIATFKSLGYVDLGSNSDPREIYMKDSTAGYVTSYTGKVIKFNPTTKAIVKTIEVGSKPEGIVESNGKLFVANSGFGYANTVSVIDLSSDNVVSTIKVGTNPRTVIKGDDNNIYVVCTGSFSDTTGRGGVFKIDYNTLAVDDSIAVYANPGEGCFVGNDILTINSNGVVRVNLTNHTVSSPIITGTKVNSYFGIIYSIAYDKTTQTIYCGNPKDFNQNGEVVAFSTDGTEKARYAAGGINPGTLLIYRK
jgi:YVTN family beta-propeller protein